MDIFYLSICVFQMGHMVVCSGQNNMKKAMEDLALWGGQHIFNLSLSCGRLPFVVPVPKSVYSKEHGHLLPVALTSQLMKTMERIILRCIRPQVSMTLDPLQFASCPRIRVDEAVTITNLEYTGGLKVLFFTFPVPFNTIQPALLKEKLRGRQLTNTLLHGPQTFLPTDHSM